MTKQGRNYQYACGRDKKFKQSCAGKPACAVSPQALIHGLRSAWAIFETQCFEQAKQLCQQIIQAVPAQIDVLQGFDSFEDIRENWHNERKGSYLTRGYISKAPSNIHLNAGLFDATLPKFLETNTEQSRLNNIECDIYSSTKTLLDLLAPRIVKGIVIIFDKYIGNQHLPEEEYKVFQEVFKTYVWKYEYLAFSFFTKQVVVRIC